MPMWFYWALFLLTGAAAIVLAKRFDDDERRRWRRGPESTPRQGT